MVPSPGYYTPIEINTLLEWSREKDFFPYLQHLGDRFTYDLRLGMDKHYDNLREPKVIPVKDAGLFDRAALHNQTIKFRLPKTHFPVGVRPGEPVYFLHPEGVRVGHAEHGVTEDETHYNVPVNLGLTASFKDHAVTRKFGIPKKVSGVLSPFTMLSGPTEGSSAKESWTRYWNHRPVDTLPVLTKELLNRLNGPSGR